MEAGQKLGPSFPLHPSTADVAEAVEEAARQMGDRGNVADRPFRELDDQLRMEGWHLYGVGEENESFDAQNISVPEGTEIKIIGRGREIYVYVRERPVDANE